MTVRELIAKLQEFPPEAPVVVIHDERGPDLVRTVERLEVKGDGGWRGDEYVVLVDN